jgi:hypothetical protein
MVISCKSQIHSWIEVSNPAPRVGDDIIVKVSFDTLMPNRAGYLNEIKNYVLQSEIKINTVATKAGMNWIGPFTFNVGGRILTSDSVLIYIEEELNIKKDTIAIRQIEFNGKVFLLIEQVLVGEHWSSSDFLEFKEKSVCKEITIKQTYSTSSTGAKFNFQTLVFEIEKHKKYKGGCLITEQNFENISSNSTTISYEIK